MNPTGSASALASTSTGAPLHILVVDDDPNVLSVEAIILRRSGHRVDTAEDGEAAWQALVGGGYDLVVTDYTMPGISGLALIRQLRVAEMTLPVVLVSGALEAADVAKVADDPWSRIDAFLHKPFSVEDLLSTVNRVLGRETAEAESGRRKLG